MKIDVDPTYPHQALFYCAAQVQLVYDLFGSGGDGETCISELGGIAIMNNMHAVVEAMTEIQKQVEDRLYPPGATRPLPKSRRAEQAPKLTEPTSPRQHGDAA